MTVFLSFFRLLEMDLDPKMNQTPCGWLIFSKNNSYKLCNIIFISVGYRVKSGRSQCLAKSIVAVQGISLQTYRIVDAKLIPWEVLPNNEI